MKGDKGFQPICSTRESVTPPIDSTASSPKEKVVNICALRCKRDFTLPKCKTERFKNSFTFSHVYNTPFAVQYKKIAFICLRSAKKRTFARNSDSITIFAFLFTFNSIFICSYVLFGIQKRKYTLICAVIGDVRLA